MFSQRYKPCPRCKRTRLYRPGAFTKGRRIFSDMLSCETWCRHCHTLIVYKLKPHGWWPVVREYGLLSAYNPKPDPVTGWRYLL